MKRANNSVHRRLTSNSYKYCISAKHLYFVYAANQSFIHNFCPRKININLSFPVLKYNITIKLILRHKKKLIAKFIK